MAAFLPSVELTDEVQQALCEGWLKFNRGQWVKFNGAKGRFISASEKGLRICWRFSGESFRSFVLRFKASTAAPVKKSRTRSRVVQLELWDNLPGMYAGAYLHVLMRSDDGRVVAQNEVTRRIHVGVPRVLRDKFLIWPAGLRGRPRFTFTGYPGGFHA